MGRYDWTLSSSDSLFGRYLFDNANLTEPFYSSFPQWSNYDRTRNQFFTLGEKHIFSNTLINSLNLGISRTFLYLHSNGTAGRSSGLFRRSDHGPRRADYGRHC